MAKWLAQARGARGARGPAARAMQNKMKAGARARPVRRSLHLCAHFALELVRAFSLVLQKVAPRMKMNSCH